MHYKIKKTLDFKLITTTGLKFYSPSFLLFCVPHNEDSGALRIGFTASKRLGGAVKRNRCKRLMRALATEVLQKNILISATCVMVARSQLLTTPYYQLKEDALSCAKRFIRSVESSNICTKNY